MRQIILCFLFFMVFIFQAFGQNVSKVGTTAAPFLNIGVGSRSIAMGGAFVATANDGSSMYWNVAGMARLSSNQAILDHSEWLADISFDYAGFILNLGSLGKVGANFTSLSMGDMLRTTENQPEGTGERFSAGSVAIGVAYARNLTDRFSIGFNVKYISEKIYNSNAQGIALDIGTLYTTPFRDLKIGMSITNFGTKMKMSGRDILIQYDIDPIRAGNNASLNANLETDTYDLPLIFRVGVSMNVLQNMNQHDLTLALDALHPNDNVESINVGGEYLFMKTVALRGGFRHLFSRDAEEGLTLGAGFKYTFIGNLGVRLDYAFQSFGRLNNVNRFSFILTF